MTNIAFTSLIFLVLAFPGYVFLASYLSNEFTRQVLVRSWTDDLAKAIISSLPFHVVGILIVEYLQRFNVIHHTLDAEIAFRMLAGEFSNTGHDYRLHFGEIVERLYQNQGYLLAYYVLILIAAWGVGHCLRYLVWNCELDLKLPAVFKFKNSWIYSILGRGQLEGVPSKDILVWIDALTDEPTEVPGKTRLYRGLVAGFTTDGNGALRDLIVTAASRSKFTLKEGKHEFSWQRIEPGDYFLIKYSEIKNLNITYRSASELVPAASVGQVPASEKSDPTDQPSPTP